MEGCCYRLRSVARSPFADVDGLEPPQRQQVARVAASMTMRPVSSSPSCCWMRTGIVGSVAAVWTGISSASRWGKQRQIPLVHLTIP